MKSHLAKDRHDVTGEITDVWCESAFGHYREGAVVDAEDASCVPCLKAAAQFGFEALTRLITLTVD